MLVVAIDFHSIFVHTMGVNGDNNFLVTHILQNIFFFWVNYPFKCFKKQ